MAMLSFIFDFDLLHLSILQKSPIREQYLDDAWSIPESYAELLEISFLPKCL